MKDRWLHRSVRIGHEASFAFCQSPLASRKRHKHSLRPSAGHGCFVPPASIIRLISPSPIIHSGPSQRPAAAKARGAGAELASSDAQQQQPSSRHVETPRQSSSRAWLAPRAWLVWLVFGLSVSPSDPTHQLLLRLSLYCHSLPDCDETDFATRRPRWMQWRQSDHRPPSVSAPGLHPSDHLCEPTQNDGGCQTIAAAGFLCLAAIIRNSTRGGLISPSRQGPACPFLGTGSPTAHCWTTQCRPWV